jgi:hypothetical protein
MAKWLKDCEICNVGLCKRMTELTAPIEKGGKGLSEREAARIMESEAADQIGEKVWSAKHIQARYRYHTGKDKIVRNSDTQTQRYQEVKVQKVETARNTKPNPVVDEPEVDPELSRWGGILSAATNIHTLTLAAKFPVEHTEYAEEALRKIQEVLPALKVVVKGSEQRSEMIKIGGRPP